MNGDRIDDNGASGIFDAPRDAGTSFKITLYAFGRLSKWGERPETIVNNNVFTFTLRGPMAGPVTAIANSTEPGDFSSSEFSNTVEAR